MTETCLPRAGAQLASINATAQDDRLASSLIDANFMPPLHSMLVQQMIRVDCGSRHQYQPLLSLAVHTSHSLALARIYPRQIRLVLVSFFYVQLLSETECVADTVWAQCSHRVPPHALVSYMPGANCKTPHCSSPGIATASALRGMRKQTGDPHASMDNAADLCLRIVDVVPVFTETPSPPTISCCRMRTQRVRYESEATLPQPTRRGNTCVLGDPQRSCTRSLNTARSLIT